MPPPRRTTPPSHGKRPAATPLPPAVLLAAWAVLLVVLGADTFRIAFFADDFHMLDVARRIALPDLLGGQHGIFPWYRPLSRELYFWLIAHAGPLELMLARVLSLGAVALAAAQLRVLGARWFSPRAGTIGAVLFVGYGLTKFLVAWGSGFQDLLAIALVLLAVREHTEQRVARALLWAVLACFAKETAALVFPLLVLHTLLNRPLAQAWRAWLPQAGALALTAAVHLLVRRSWHSGGRSAEVVRSAGDLVGALVRLLGGFLGRIEAPSALTLLLAVLAVGAAVLLVTQASAQPWRAAADAPDRAPVLFVGVAALAGLAPLLVGHTLGVVTASSYYAYSAVPWACLLVALALTRLPQLASVTLVVVLVGGNTLALGYRAPDLSSPGAWDFREWDWNESMRLSAVAQRYGDDLRALLATRPESTVVLFSEMPEGAFFQSEDGPATREALRDRTVRSYWLNAPPYGLDPARVAMVSLDGGTRHLVPYEPDDATRSKLAASSVAAGEAATAWVYATAGGPQANQRFDFHYYAAAAALVGEGVAGMQRELALMGLADTAGPAPAAAATEAVGPSGPMHTAMLAVLRRPLDARTHLALADVCRDANAVLFEGVELRYAVTLDPSLHAERLRLAKSLLEKGKPAAARHDLERLAADAKGTPIGVLAEGLLQPH
ncbi:MAG: hypothetical protein ABL977_01420 [Candidatus Eisenbacteria bacterium]